MSVPPISRLKQVRSGIPARRLLLDKVARWVVVGGGMAIIAAILGILVFIIVEIWPLVRGAEVRVADTIALDDLDARALVVDEYQSHAIVLGADGTISVIQLDEERELERRSLLEPCEVEDRGVADAAATASDGDAACPEITRVLPRAGGSALAALTDDGALVVRGVSFATRFDDDGKRSILFDLAEAERVVLGEPGETLGAVAVTSSRDGGSLVAAAQREDGSIEIVQRRRVENAFTGEIQVDERRRRIGGAPPLAELTLTSNGRSVFAARPDGTLLYWADSSSDDPPYVARGAASPVTALGLLLGERSLVVGRANGVAEVWLPLRRDGAIPTEVLEKVRIFEALPAAIDEIVRSQRNKGFIALAADGTTGLYHSTSHRLLWRGPAPVDDPHAVFFSPRADGAVFAGGTRIGRMTIGNPHPEVSLQALFGKVWYEGFQEPEYIWQSSSGTDDFEPKLSLTPLIVGTLKGTAYSLILAIPLGVFGAMYASQFMHPSLRNAIKPTVEIMAALPSVVLGFLAGLWLAPRLERLFPSLLLMAVIIPLATVLTGLAWSTLPASLRNRLPAGAEIVAFLVTISGAIWISLALSPALEAAAFGGSFPLFIHEQTGIPYDQRNAIVVGIGMGFAVIPIIFSVAEDAFSNVPRGLVSGSLALGATRWQTVTRIVLPTASPGIFSAIMIGFGRAVGETMIVLMATGNTPIMDWFPFNGFRTLSANIAVEIPEAPQGGTLYRTLFLAALLLFVLTFVINTIAELVRQRLRRRFANL